MNKQEIENLIKILIQKTVEVVGEVSVTEKSVGSSAPTIWFNVEVRQPHLYLNRDADALFALNHLAKKIIESNIQRTEENPFSPFDIMIDINGYQKQKIEKIHATAHMMAERARYFKTNAEIEPMTSWERRIVHEFLSDATDLKTESVGMGPDRKVVIKYIGAI